MKEEGSEQKEVVNIAERELQLHATGLKNNKPQDIMYTAKTSRRDPMDTQETWRNTP